MRFLLIFFQLVIQDGWDSNSTCKHYSHVSLLLDYLPLKICDTFVTPFLGGVSYGILGKNRIKHQLKHAEMQRSFVYSVYVMVKDTNWL